MKTNNNTSILTWTLVCTLGAAFIYLFKWAKFYFMPASILQVAEVCGNFGKYLDMSGYEFLSVCIYGGAILALVFLIVDAYKIARPLLNGEDDVESAIRSGAGRVLSIIFTVFFIIIVYAANDGELDGATITLWPVVSVALCIAAKLMLGRLEIVPEESSQRFAMTLAAQETRATVPDCNSEKKTENAIKEDGDSIVLPVINYSIDCSLQPAQIICSRSEDSISLLIACYQTPEVLEAIRVNLSFTSVFGDIIDAGEVFFNHFRAVSTSERRYVQTEFVKMDMLSNRVREMVSARVIITRVKTVDDSIQIPRSYSMSILPVELLKALKKGSDRDVVCEKKELGYSWICACGAENGVESMHCHRCRRNRNGSKRQNLIRTLEQVERYEDLMKVLDQGIEDGWTELAKVKEDCVITKKYSRPADEEIIRIAKKNVAKLEDTETSGNK